MRKLICTMLVLILLSCLAFGCKADEAKLPPKDENGFYILPKATFAYNIVQEGTSIPDYVPPDGYFQEELDDYEVEQLLPDGRFLCTDSRASWDGTGKQLSVSVNFQVGKQIIHVRYSVHPNACLDTSNKKITRCNGVAYVVHEYISNDVTMGFEAIGYLGNQPVLIIAECPPNDPEQGRADFETAVRWMSICNAKQIDATTVRYSQIPEYYRLELKLSEAHADPTFGHLLPENLPAGFRQDRIIRYKDYRTDFLFASWDHNKNEHWHLRWRIKCCAPEDEANLVSSSQVSPDTIRKMQEPMLRIEDISIEILEAILIDDNTFYTKIDNYLIKIDFSGISAEDMYGLLQQVR